MYYPRREVQRWRPGVSFRPCLPAHGSTFLLQAFFVSRRNGRSWPFYSWIPRQLLGSYWQICLFGGRTRNRIFLLVIVWWFDRVACLEVDFEWGDEQIQCRPCDGKLGHVLGRVCFHRYFLRTAIWTMRYGEWHPGAHRRSAMQLRAVEAWISFVLRLWACSSLV